MALCTPAHFGLALCTVSSAHSFSSRVLYVSRHTVDQLTSLRHFNGRPVAVIYTGAKGAAAALAQPPVQPPAPGVHWHPVETFLTA